MAAGGLRDQLDADKAFFGNADQRSGCTDSWHQPVADDASFIEHHFEPNAALSQQLGDLPSASGAADLLVMAVREISRASGLKPFAEQPFDGLERANDL